MANASRAGLVTVLVLAAATAVAAPPQTLCQGRACTAADFQAGAAELHQLKTELVGAIRQFAEAAAGSYGDEGRLLAPALDAVQQALDSWDRAIAVYESAARSATEDADIHAALGSVYLDRSRIRDALAEFATAARIDSRRADVHQLSAMAYDLAGESSNAAAELEKAAALAPADVTIAYRLVHAYGLSDSPKAVAAARRVDAANLAPQRDPIRVQFDRVGLMRQAAGFAPIFPPQRYAAGFRLLDAGRYSEGIASLRQAAASDPLATGTPGNAAALAGARLRQGQLQAALSGLRDALTRAPDAETFRASGVAYWADEQYDRSAEAFASAIRIDDQDERARIARADVLLAAGKRSEAEQALKETIAALPDSGQAHYRLGEIYQSESLVADAIAEFDRATSAGPLIGLDHLYETLGGLYATQADFTHAADMYRKRVDVNPNYPDAHRKLGEIYVLLDRNDAALAEFAVTEWLDPKNAEAFAEAAQVYVRGERFADAERTSRQALALDPSNQKARFVLGTSLVRLGHAADGRRELDQFQHDVDATANARRRMLDLNTLERDASRAETSGDLERAAALLTQAVERAPEDSSRQLELARVLVKAGRPQSALDRLAQLKESGDAADLHRVAADAYAALGQADAREREETRYRQLVEQRKEERLKNRPLLR